jgi:hypothetical protein
MRFFREKYSDEVSTLETHIDKKVRVSTDTEFAKLYEIRDMNILISSEQKREIIERIFDNNEEKYQRIITLFNFLKTWQDARYLLKLIFNSNKLNPKSGEAGEFTAIVRNCFEE